MQSQSFGRSILLYPSRLSCTPYGQRRSQVPQPMQASLRSMRYLPSGRRYLGAAISTFGKVDRAAKAVS